MDQERVLRFIGAASGLVAAVLMFSGGIIKDIEVAATSSSTTIAAALIESQQSVFIGTYLLMLGVLFFLFFIGYLRSKTSERSEGQDWLSRTAFGAGLVGSAMLLLSAHFGQSLTVLSSYGSDTQVAKSLYLLDWNWYLLVEAIPIAVFIGASSADGLTCQDWPWWLTWPGLAISLLLVLPFVTGGGMMLSYLWIGALSLYSIRQDRRPIPLSTAGNRAGFQQLATADTEDQDLSCE